MLYEKNNLNWRRLYFGKVSPSEVQEAIHNDEWQTVRISMKGKTLEAKYRILSNYYDRTFTKVVGDDHAIRMLRVRVTNYITALSRGGLICPSDYR